MSRCFPFPPPGYEIKASAENVNLILKEKHKLKKHKDKKDKDKKEKKERSERKEKERSEKKENERSEGKRKDGKDRKQKKHKDDKDRKKDKLKSLEEKKIDNFIPDDSKPSNGIEDYRNLAELGKRVRNDGEATHNETVEKKIILVERKHDNNGHTLEVSRNGYARYFTGEHQIDGIEKRNEGKEKNENERNENGNRHKKNENRDKKREEKKRKKERKKEEEAKREEKKRKKERKKEKEAKERSKENIKQRENDGDVVYSRPSDHLKENGFLHENGFRTHNTSSAAAISSSHDQVTNSTKVKLVETGRKPDNKELELKMNGVLEQHKMDNSSMPSLKTKEKKVRISTKPPHADLKYMSQILTVPKLDFSPQFDDQDWLFGYKDPQSKRPKLDSSHVESHVWAEAIVLGPADFIAMPYVIPY